MSDQDLSQAAIENNGQLLRERRNVSDAEQRLTESWSPRVGSMMALVPPDPDFIRLKRRLKRSRDNIRQSRTDFFCSPSVTRTPTPNDMMCGRRTTAPIAERLWEQQPPPQPIDRLSVPSIRVTSNSGSPMSFSDHEDEFDCGASTSSLSLRYLSDTDDDVVLRRPSMQSGLNPVPVTRSQSFQEAGTFANKAPLPADLYTSKRIASDDLLGTQRMVVESAQRSHNYHQNSVGFGASSCLATSPLDKELHVKPHMVSRLIAKMRRVTLDWRRANRNRRGELSLRVFSST